MAAARSPSRSKAATVAPAAARAVAIPAPMPAAAGHKRDATAQTTCWQARSKSSVSPRYLDHPFIAPLAIPRTNQRCIHRKKITMGSTDNVTYAVTVAHEMPMALNNSFTRRTCTDCISGLRVNVATKM